MFELTLTFFGNKNAITTKFRTLDEAKSVYEYARQYHGKGLKGGTISFPLPGNNSQQQ